MRLVDTHAHLDFDQFSGEEEQVVERARAAGVDRIITVGTTLERSRQAAALAERFEGVSASVGVHPHDAAAVTAEAVAALRELAARPEVVAIGEIGFDFHYPDGPDEAVQERALRSQAEIAIAQGLPLIIHSRQAEAQTLACLPGIAQALKRDWPGVVHCFDGSAEFATRILEAGFLISCTAIVGYPKNDALRIVIKEVPLDRLMIETDCPFLAPQERRGQRNEPAFVVSTAEKIAELKDIPIDEVATATTRNAARLFGL